MAKTPVVSIITPSFNSQRFIAESIESVLRQKYSNWELIVADDGSFDDTVGIVRAYSEVDSRVKLLEGRRRQGPGPARNRALREARGRYVAFLDSDDRWHPDKLLSQIEFMKRYSAVFSFTAYEIIDECGKPYGSIVNAPSRISYNDLLKNTVIGCLTVMVDTSGFRDLSMPDIPGRQPLVVWLRILRSGLEGFGLNEILAQYRIVRGSVSRNKLNAARYVWRVYREYEGLNVWVSAYYFVHYALHGLLRNRRHLKLFK